MESLNTQTVNTSFSYGTQAQNNGNQVKIEIGAPSVTIPKPLSYQFRVAEYVDKNKKITKVRLQIRICEHDNYGYAFMKNDWHDVERVQIDESV